MSEPMFDESNLVYSNQLLQELGFEYQPAGMETSKGTVSGAVYKHADGRVASLCADHGFAIQIVESRHGRPSDLKPIWSGAKLRRLCEQNGMRAEWRHKIWKIDRVWPTPPSSSPITLTAKELETITYFDFLALCDTMLFLN